MKNLINKILGFINLKIVNKRISEIKNSDFFLYQYDSYEEYEELQVKHNLRKITNVWADENSLNFILNFLKSKTGNIKGLCHGSRNGFEQNFFNKITSFEVIGTDISPSANDYENSVVWDFHKVKEEWVANFDFVYTNSHDQSFKPSLAIETWLNQLKPDGYLFIEHSEDHGPRSVGEMDPFGVKPNVFCHILVSWFGHQISFDYQKIIKSNTNQPTYVFIIKKNDPTISLIKRPIEDFRL